MSVFLTQGKLDDDGYPVRDRASSSYIATFEPAATFGDLVKAGEIRRGAEHVRQMTIIGDGAAWIWGIAAAVRRYPLEGLKKDEVTMELGYFLNNAPRMRYHWFGQCGLFVGSGVVEAGCKAVVGQRLKQSGMHWTVSGADAIIALRCTQASSQREAICSNRHSQTGAA
jgi:hypothetical protein